MGTKKSDSMCLFYVVYPHKFKTQKIVKKILEEKLAVCVNEITGVTSTYIWKGKIESSQEKILIIKTHQKLKAKLQNVLQSTHPYETAFIACWQAQNTPKYIKYLTGELFAT